MSESGLSRNEPRVEILCFERDRLERIFVNKKPPDSNFPGQCCGNVAMTMLLRSLGPAPFQRLLWLCVSQCTMVLLVPGLLVVSFGHFATS